MGLTEFSEAFYCCLQEEGITIPVALHLDHTKDFHIIETAVKHNFTSVMIDASDLSFQDNAEVTRKVVAFARPGAFRWKRSWAGLALRTLLKRRIRMSCLPIPRKRRRLWS